MTTSDEPSCIAPLYTCPGQRRNCFDPARPREDRAVLRTTHDLAGAMYGCDRIALLNRTVVAVGTPAALAGEDGLWMRTFGIGERSPLLRMLKAAA